MSEAAAQSALRDDLRAVIAIASLAAITSDIAHEALGHGSACLLAGQHITLLNDAFFKCSQFGRFTALAGPLGNLTAGVIALAAQPFIPARRPALRLYALLVMAFSFYWEAGYLIQAMIKDSGDSVFAYRELIGPENGTVRGIAAALGVAAYFFVTALLNRRAGVFMSAPGRAERLLRTSWLTGVAVMAASGAMFAPDRLGALHDAGLSIAASFPLLLPRPLGPARSDYAAPVMPSLALQIFAGIAVIAFAAAMGRGMAF